MFVATCHLLESSPISRKLIAFESYLLKERQGLTIPAFCATRVQACDLVSAIRVAMQDGSAGEQSARSQVSGGAGVLLKAAGLHGGAEAEMAAALVVASPAGAAGATAVPMPGV